jgi:HAD superfamily hydrolase (TIGR01509 family)
MPLPNNYFKDTPLDALLNKAEVVVFDLNGLMVDDEPLQLAASNIALAALSKSDKPIELSNADWGEKCVGHRSATWLPIVLGRPLAEGEQEKFKIIKDHEYSRLVGEKARTKDPDFVRPGVLELIDYISTKTNKQLALATSARRSIMERILGKDGLDVLSLFKITLCAEEIKKPKPDPESYFKVKEQLGQTRRYLVIEDSVPGVRSAKGAEMDCIAMPNDYTISQDGLQEADAIVDSLRRKAAHLFPVTPKVGATPGKKGFSQYRR